LQKASALRDSKNAVGEPIRWDYAGRGLVLEDADETGFGAGDSSVAVGGCGAVG
jgi:hypothetical protein